MNNGEIEIEREREGETERSLEKGRSQQSAMWNAHRMKVEREREKDRVAGEGMRDAFVASERDDGS